MKRSVLLGTTAAGLCLGLAVRCGRSFGPDPAPFFWYGIGSIGARR